MALFIEITAADGLVSRTRLEPGNNRFTVRLGDSYRIFDDQSGLTPPDVAVKRVDNSLVVDGLGSADGAAGAAEATVEFAEFYSVCSAGSPCQLTVDQGAGAAPIAITPGTQPIGALADGSFVLYDQDYAETAPAEPSLGDDTGWRYALYGLGGAAVVGLAAGGGGGGGGDGGGGEVPDGSLRMTSPPFVNSRTPTLTGQGEPGATVTVRIDTNGDGVPDATYETTVAADYTWSVNLASAVPTSGALPPDGLPDSSNVGVTSTTAGGNVSLPTFVLAFDGVAPEAAVINAIAGDNVVNAAEKTAGVAISGTAEAGATVTVSWQGQVQTAVANPDGTWQTPGFNVQSIPDGQSTISVVVQDPAGNNSAATEAAISVNTAPAKLTLAPGNEAINAAEAAAGITLSGTTDPNGVVTVTWNNAAKAPVTANESGGWSVPIAAAEIPQLATGDVPYSIAATNLIGNSNTLTGRIDVDAVPPPPPQIVSVGGDNQVNAQEVGAGVVVGGTAEAGADVAVTWGGLTGSARAGGDGNWSATLTPGNGGAALVSAVAVDPAGNTSGAGQFTSFSVDTTPPQLTAVASGGLGTDNVINIAEAPGGILFSGTTEANATVSVTFNGAPIAVSVTGTSWQAAASTPASGVPGGETFAATVTATDLAGNSTVLSPTVIVDQVAPLPAVNVVAGGPPNQVPVLSPFSVSGNAEPNSSVAVTIGGQTLTATASDAGAWETPQFLGQILPGVGTGSVTVTDSAGNATLPVPFNFIVSPIIGASVPEAPAEPPLGMDSLISASTGELASTPITATSWSPAEVTATLVPLEQPLS